eukprot:SAG11_NODE_2080_length_3853_cov_12.378796_2_plen_227_part_00
MAAYCSSWGGTCFGSWDVTQRSCLSSDPGGYIHTSLWHRQRSTGTHGAVHEVLRLSYAYLWWALPGAHRSRGQLRHCIFLYGCYPKRTLAWIPRTLLLVRFPNFHTCKRKAALSRNHFSMAQSSPSHLASCRDDVSFAMVLPTAAFLLCAIIMLFCACLVEPGILPIIDAPPSQESPARSRKLIVLDGISPPTAHLFPVYMPALSALASWHVSKSVLNEASSDARG